MRIGEITGLTRDDIVINDEALENKSFTILANKNVSKIPNIYTIYRKR